MQTLVKSGDNLEVFHRICNTRRLSRKIWIMNPPLLHAMFPFRVRHEDIVEAVCMESVTLDTLQWLLNMAEGVDFDQVWERKTLLFEPCRCCIK